VPRFEHQPIGKGGGGPFGIPFAKRSRIPLDAIKHLLLREAQVQPLCLIFEDLHVSDRRDQALLNSLGRRGLPRRLLLLVKLPPGVSATGLGQQDLTTRSFGSEPPLPPASADEFLRRLLGA